MGNSKMLTAILSALGIGGFGAALYFVPGLLDKVMELAKGLLSVIRDNPWPAIAIALALFGAWTWHGWSVADDRADTLAKALKAKTAELALCSSERDQAKTAVANLNGQIDKLAKDSAERQSAAQAALAAAQARSATAEAHAALIEQNALREAPGGPDCQTPPDILGSRGDL